MIKKIQKNKVFKFLSSVKMAVPLMLLLVVVVATGTIYESRYNADVASFFVYKSKWFQALLGLLWVNIFCSTVSRWPFKIHHTGFVITHIGLLTLLIGAQVTAVSGIDGQLRVIEGSSGNTVFIPKNVLKVFRPGSEVISTYTVDRSFDRLPGEDLHLERFAKENGIQAEQYIPFAQKNGGQTNGGSSDPNAINLNFRLQSQFFDVQQALNTVDHPEMQMGPATLRLKKGLLSDREPNSVAPKRNPARAGSAGSGELVVVDAQGAEVKKIPISELKKGPIRVKNTEVRLVQVFRNAMVDGGKLKEQGSGNQNPALELMLKTGAESLREVSYEKFPNFSLRKSNTLGLSFHYRSGGGVDQVDTAVTAHGETGQNEAPPMVDGSGGNIGPGGNVIEFHADPEKSGEIFLVLSKRGKKVLQQKIKPGQEVVTPWMGMKITVLSISKGGNTPSGSSAGTPEIQEVPMVPKAPLPPSAIYLRVAGSGAANGVWLLEGESAKISTAAGEMEVYYGMDSIDLPFRLKLEKFQKVNYPGTETAMSFQSTVRINEVGPPIEIKMNEPLQYQGFTLYQSSFEMGQGMQTASIFSVNHDPGRVAKYVGAIILSLGIVVFTVMRSRWYLERVKA